MAVVTTRLPLADTRSWDLSGPVIRTLMLAGGIQIAFLLPSIIAFAYEDRTVNDINLWIKPIKFQLSLLSTILTVAVLVPLMSDVAKSGRLSKLAAWLIAFWSTTEIAYIVIQAARGTASHFNVATPVERVAYQLMAFGAISIVLGCFLIGWQIWRQGKAEAGTGLKAGAASGLMLGAVLTLITAMIMGSGQISDNSHWVGGVRSDLGGLPLVGWSRSGGDLRVPHFFATHLMQGLPILGLVADRLAPGNARMIVALGAVLGVAIVGATFAQAAMGIPFI